MKDIHSIVKLLKNHIYPTYQLHAYMRNAKISPTEGLIIGALTVCEWLRSRLGEDIPEQLQLPAPAEYQAVSLEMFKSLHFNRGFVVDIISLPEKEMWSLQIVEPDLGSDPGNPNQVRKPIAGRIIETNVGFAVRDNKLECGIKTVISDPENTPPAMVYRPAFVKKLYNNPDFGLQNMAILSPKLKYIDTLEQLKAFVALLKNEKNQLPAWVFTKPCEVKYEDQLPLESLSVEQLATKHEAADIDDKGNIIKKIEVENTCTKLQAAKEKQKAKKKNEGKITVNSFNELRVLAQNPMLQQKHPVLKTVNESRKKTQKYVLPPYNMHKLAGAFTGFAYVYLLNEKLFSKFCELLSLNMTEGDAVFFEPQCFGAGNVIYPYFKKNTNEKDIIRLTFQYPREKDVDFHNIYFLSGARDALIQGKQELEELSESQMNQWQIKLLAAQKQSEAVINAQKEELAKLDSKNSSLKQQLVIEETKNKNMREKQAQLEVKHQLELEKRDQYIAFLERQVARPHTKKELPDWVAKTHKEHLLLHPKAIQTFEAAFINNDRLELIYDALDYMATDYWENRYGDLSEEELLNRCSQKYHRAFEITPCKGTSIEVYPEQYRIPYFKDEQGRVKPSDLNFHMRAGNKAEHLVRIYFLFDEVKKLIVVGSMPEHLQTVTFG